tara:strand:+ start:376 stop:588 length:213 start_codon:yes stop_codon:yes gene_type:complete
MCTPFGVAGLAAHQLGVGRRKDEQKVEVKNYYGAQDATTVPDTPNRDVLKSDTPTLAKPGHTGSTTNRAY